MRARLEVLRADWGAWTGGPKTTDATKAGSTTRVSRRLLAVRLSTSLEGVNKGRVNDEAGGRGGQGR